MLHNRAAMDRIIAMPMAGLAFTISINAILPMMAPLLADLTKPTLRETSTFPRSITYMFVPASPAHDHAAPLIAKHRSPIKLRR